MSNEEYEQTADDDETPEQRAQLELKRAYVQLGFGQFDEAMASCDRAAELVGEHYLPDTLRGAILSASGRHADALAELKRVRKRYPSQALPHLYFAEACYLSGRERQGERALEDADGCEMSEHEAEFSSQLRQLWNQVEPEDVPPPLEPVQ